MADTTEMKAKQTRRKWPDSRPQCRPAPSLCLRGCRLQSAPHSLSWDRGRRNGLRGAWDRVCAQCVGMSHPVPALAQPRPGRGTHSPLVQRGGVSPPQVPGGPERTTPFTSMGTSDAQHVGPRGTDQGARTVSGVLCRVCGTGQVGPVGWASPASAPALARGGGWLALRRSGSLAHHMFIDPVSQVGD